jgi:hypothetical protein
MSTCVCVCVLWSYGAVYFYTTFIRAITSLPQIRQVARLRSTTCNLQGLSPTQRSTQTTPSRDLTLGGKTRCVCVCVCVCVIQCVCVCVYVCDPDLHVYVQEIQNLGSAIFTSTTGPDVPQGLIPANVIC